MLVNAAIPLLLCKSETIIGNKRFDTCATTGAWITLPEDHWFRGSQCNQSIYISGHIYSDVILTLKFAHSFSDSAQCFEKRKWANLKGIDGKLLFQL